jgi:serine protease Do
MKSVLRFLLFVLVAGMAVGLLYFWSALRRVEEFSGSDVGSTALISMDEEFTGLVARVLPSVVSIVVTSSDGQDTRLRLMQMWQGDRAKEENASMGSGVIVSESGHIVTNLHVVSRAARIEVHLSDGRMLPARLVGDDALSDIAILKIEAEGLRPLSFGDSDLVRVGQMVIAVGNPLGLEETVTQGIISAKGRRAASEAANEFFQTDAAINQGNSGGPLVDMRGRIIGINNSISPQGQGIGFSIPSNTVRRVFESIRDFGRFIRPWFGAYVRSLTPEVAAQLALPDSSGALVLLVYEGSPAEMGGLRAWDVIVEFNGEPVLDVRELRNRVAKMDVGEKVTMRVRRRGAELDLQTVIAAEPGLQ